MPKRRWECYPVNCEKAAPIIIFGMHRSGTSLLTAMLGECGVFWGRERDEYQESLPFQALNEKLFEFVGATWDHPGKVAELLMTDDGFDRAVSLLRPSIDENFFKAYFGDNKDPAGNWGWKDPRNTFLIPLWLEIFPGARLVHLVRNGVDVAKSLWKRETTRPEGENHVHYSERGQSPEGCFSLWEEYVRAARGIVDAGQKCIEIRFEDLLGDPVMVLKGVANFLGLPESVDLNNSVRLIRAGAGLSRSGDDFGKSFLPSARDNSLLRELYD